MKCSHIIIFCVYRPPPSKKNKFTPAGFLDEFEQFLDNHFSLNVPTIILVDINFHYDCPDEFNVLKMYDVLKLRDLSQCVSVPTHDEGHTLDWVIVHEAFSHLLSNFTVLDKAVSDHSLITFKLNITIPSTQTKSIMSRNLRLLDPAVLNDDLAICNDL